MWRTVAEASCGRQCWKPKVKPLFTSAAQPCGATMIGTNEHTTTLEGLDWRRQQDQMNSNAEQNGGQKRQIHSRRRVRERVWLYVMSNAEYLPYSPDWKRSAPLCLSRSAPPACLRFDTYSFIIQGQLGATEVREHTCPASRRAQLQCSSEQRAWRRPKLHVSCRVRAHARIASSSLALILLREPPRSRGADYCLSLAS